MKKVNLQPLNDNVIIKTEANLLEALLANKLDVIMACKGRGLCATCHVHIKEGADKLTPVTPIEERRLSVISGVGKTSRLACQAKVLQDGVVVEVPEGMYVESVNDLYRLIGRRAENDILNPVDGSILIQKGKLITKSKVIELESINFDVLNIRNSSRDIF